MSSKEVIDKILDAYPAKTMKNRKLTPWTKQLVSDGPLSLNIDEYSSLLKKQGYLPIVVKSKVRLIFDFSRWLQQKKISIKDINSKVTVRYFQCRHHFYKPGKCDSSTMKQFLKMLCSKSLLRPEPKKIEIIPTNISIEGTFLIDMFFS